MRENEAVNCMTLIVGKSVAEGGRVLVAHNEDDSGNISIHRRYVPAQDHPAGETVPAERGRARIPQVAHTLGYYWIEYLTDEGGLSAADAFMNECGVVVTSNSMGVSKEDDQDESVVKDGGLAYVLRRALAERSHSAREGAQILMSLVNEWGYAPSGRAYTIADKNEAFMFQLVRGRHYLGARVPDDAVVVMPNHYTLHTLHDCPEMFYPEDVVQYAIDKGWYVPARADRSDFDFAAAYQGEKTFRGCMNVYRQKHGQRIVLGRDWDLETEGTPFAVYPDHPIGVETLARVMATHYEGTEDDADSFGPGRNPHNSEDHRRICSGTTLESDIWCLADDPAQSCVYTCMGRPCEVPYVPLHPLLDLPASLRETDDAAAAMARHLEPHAGVSAAGNRVWHRFRRLCGAQEMLYCDVRARVAEKLKTMLEAAQRASAAVSPENATVEDEKFLMNALAEMEALAAHFKLIEMNIASPIILNRADATVEVEFALSEAPEEETLLFGVEYTDLRKEFSPAMAGSLRQTENGYAAQFELRSMLPVLPNTGRYPFWLGGRTKSGRAFAGSAVVEVVRAAEIIGEKE